MVHRKLKIIAVLMICFTSASVAKEQDAIDRLQQDASWQLKLKKSIYFHLQEANFLEAWRISQLALTTETPVEHLDYLIALTGAKLQVCPLAYTTSQRWRDHLLYAYGFRFRQKFAGPSQARSPYEQVNTQKLVSQLNIHQHLYLEDILNASPLKRSGCGLQKNTFNDRNESEKKEFLHLWTWFRIKDANQKLEGESKAVFRLFQLAQKHGEEDDQKTLEKYFLTFNGSDWLTLDDPERALMWQILAKQSKSHTIPLNLSHPLENTVEQIILQSQDPQVSHWLAAIEFNQLTPSRQLKLLNHLLAIEQIELKPWLLNQKMILTYRSGQMDESLRLIRRLTLEGESNGIDTIEQNAIKVASFIFSEFRYDTKILGTIQSSLPSSHWLEVYRYMLFHHALAGNKRGYQAMMQNIDQQKSRKRLRLKENQMQLLEALLNRSATQFQKHLVDSSKSRWQTKDTLQLFDQIAEEVFRLSTERKNILNPFLLQIAEFSLKHVKKEHQLKKLEFLLSIYDREKRIDWNQGSITTRQGTQMLGQVDLSSDSLVESQFIWKEVFDIPKRDLLAYPVNSKEDRWIIK